MIKPLLGALVLIAGLATTALAGDASELSVLYVGLDPDEPVPDALVRYAGEHEERQRGLYAERTPAFMAFLREHFETVGFVAGDDWVATMSNDYDVTIFDTLPPVLGDGDEQAWPRIRLPEGFDRPTLTIGEVGPLMLGRMGLGLKIDHL